MRLLITTMMGYLMLFSAMASADSVRVTDVNIPFFYESRAEIPTTEHNLAELLSVDYRKAKDEFTRMELFQKIKPVIDKKLEEFGATEAIIVLVGSRLKEYDFEKGAFPTDFSSNTYIPFDNGYAVNFNNARVLEYLEIPLNEAKKLATMLQKTRKVTFEITTIIESASEQRVDYRTNKLLTTRISAVDVKAKDGSVIHRITISEVNTGILKQL